MKEYPKGVSKQCSIEILDQMNNSICLINEKSLGFFCNIIYRNKNIRCLITSYKVINELYKINDKNIQVKINEEIKTIEFGENNYIDKLNDIIIIEIKENKDNKIKFLDLDEKIYEKENENNYYFEESIYTVYIGQKQNIYVSYGVINYLNISEIIFSCNINSNSECSPIFNLSNNKIIGIYNKKSIYYNKGILLKFMVNEFIKESKYFKDDKNNKISPNEIDILINVEKDDINKEIYFLDNYYTSKSFENEHELYINDIKKEDINYLIPEKEGKYNIKLKFKKNIKDCSFMFSGCENIISINFQNFNTGNISNMKGMFSNCKNLKSINLFSFNTKNVIDISYMFFGCKQLNNLDLSSFDLKNVKNIDNMIFNCEQLNDVTFSSFDNENVNKINEMININKDLNESEIIKDNNKYDYYFKLIILGDAGVGKQKLVQAAIHNIFKNTDNPNIGSDLSKFIIKYKNKSIQFEVWDTCGQERYRSLISSFYRNSSLVIFVYAINNIDSLNSIEIYLNDCRLYCSPDIKTFLVGNKIDIPEKE